MNSHILLAKSGCEHKIVHINIIAKMNLKFEDWIMRFEFNIVWNLWISTYYFYEFHQWIEIFLMLMDYEMIIKNIT